jgi:hypothetical protein
MTITTFGIYLISQADTILTLSRIGIIVLTSLAVFFFFCRLDDKQRYINSYDEKRREADIKERDICVKMWSKTITKSIIAAIFFSILSITIPSTKTLIAMYAIPPIVNDHEVQKLPDNLLRFINNYLEKEGKK